eukprot:GEMP01020104.1.p1 GENE.GEMP01020104.1~~GEMP01020104.1.p1  ORF type:complete len:691 (+),score=132.66 GEMP01020104.1:88-2160(+)
MAPPTNPPAIVKVLAALKAKGANRLENHRRRRCQRYKLLQREELRLCNVLSARLPPCPSASPASRPRSRCLVPDARKVCNASRCTMPRLAALHAIRATSRMRTLLSRKTENASLSDLSPLLPCPPKIKREVQSAEKSTSRLKAKLQYFEYRFFPPPPQEMETEMVDDGELAKYLTLEKYASPLTEVDFRIVAVSSQRTNWPAINLQPKLPLSPYHDADVPEGDPVREESSRNTQQTLDVRVLQSLFQEAVHSGRITEHGAIAMSATEDARLSGCRRRRVDRFRDKACHAATNARLNAASCKLVVINKVGAKGRDTVQTVMSDAVNGGRRDAIGNGGKVMNGLPVAPQEADDMLSQASDGEHPIRLNLRTKHRISKPHRDRWESAPYEASYQWLIFDLKRRYTVTEIDLTLSLGSDMNPKSCAVQYSEASYDGPWADAFSFMVASKKLDKWNAMACYDKNVREFQALLIQQFGSVHEAWTKALDPSGAGHLSYSEFHKAALQLGRKGAFAWKDDIQRLFEDLDANGNGVIDIDDLAYTGGRKPSSRYWRLMIYDNWGSSIGTGLSRPLVIYGYTSPKVVAPVNYLRTMSIAQEYALQGMVVAFLDGSVSSRDRLPRNMAEAYDISGKKVDDASQKIKKHDEDGSGNIDYDEFRSELHGLMQSKYPSFFSESRIKTMWRTAMARMAGNSTNF